jgi:hypothetical protein
MAEQGWFNAGEIMPRDLAPNPRCQDCQTGGMKHLARPGRRCGVGFGEGCDCDESGEDGGLLRGYG